MDTSCISDKEILEKIEIKILLLTFTQDSSYDLIWQNLAPDTEICSFLGPYYTTNKVMLWLCGTSQQFSILLAWWLQKVSLNDPDGKKHWFFVLSRIVKTHFSLLQHLAPNSKVHYEVITQTISTEYQKRFIKEMIDT